MMRNANIFFIVMCSCTFIIFLLTGQSSLCGSTYSSRFFTGSKETDPNLKRVREIYDEWNECMSPSISEMRNMSADYFWRNIYKPIEFCENNVTGVHNLPLMAFSNSDETKWTMMPKNNQEKSEIVTIGIGQDVAAELALREELEPENVNFYGADPIVSGNEKLYTEFGKYFPFAIGNSSILAESSVLVDGLYVNQKVLHMEFINFLKEIIQKKFFDNIWIDGEGAEYEIFDYFFNDGKLDQNDITICQFNMEMHQPDDWKKSEIQRFLLKIFDDRRYVFLRPIQATHLRLYFINFSDERCISKYNF